MRLSATDPQARRALLARQRLLQLLGGREGKFTALDALLHEYALERVLIFTEHNTVVYDIARRHPVPPITHETVASERNQILDGFQTGHYSVSVPSRVLNHGI